MSALRWMTAIQDLRTRCVVGWHLGPAPHQDAILAAARMAFRGWAIPGVMRIDNGKDFTSKPITGFSKRQRDRLRRVYIVAARHGTVTGSGSSAAVGSAHSTTGMANVAW